jgi:hypothetical protein
VAIASVGSWGIGSSGASGTTLLLAGTLSTIEAGNVAMVLIAADNTGTTDADHSQVSSIADSVGGNTWTKIEEYTNGQGSAGTGVTVSLWQSRLTNAITSTDDITVTFGGAITDKCGEVWEFTVGGALTEAAAAVPNATDGSNGFGSVQFSGLASASRLYLRALAKEVNPAATAFTASAGFTAMPGTRSRNNAAAVCIRGEFIIATSTGQTSNPTFAIAGDTAGVFVALTDVPAASGNRRRRFFVL